MFTTNLEIIDLWSDMVLKNVPLDYGQSVRNPYINYGVHYDSGKSSTAKLLVYRLLLSCLCLPNIV